MESFYHRIRRQTGLLVDGSEPGRGTLRHQGQVRLNSVEAFICQVIGWRWTFDDNRESVVLRGRRCST